MLELMRSIRNIFSIVGKIMKSLSEVESFLEFLGQPILIINDASEIVFANSACLHLFGYQKNQMQQCRIEDLTSNSEKLNHAKIAKNFIRSKVSAKEMTERNLIPCIDSDGKKFDTRISIASARIGDELYGVAILQDYTSIQSVISELESKSNIDMLTGLFNRRYLHEVLKTDSRINNTWASTGVLYLDLNKFKPVNDNLGHKIGDEILKIVAVRLKDLVRFDDIVFRAGGDEFIILLNLTEVTDKLKILKKICSKICEIISKPIAADNSSVNISVSIGAGIYPDHKDELTELIDLADKAMYIAKNNGISVSFVEPSLQK